MYVVLEESHLNLAIVSLRNWLLQRVRMKSEPMVPPSSRMISALLNIDASILPIKSQISPYACGQITCSIASL